MNKRKFLKSAFVSGAGAFTLPALAGATFSHEPAFKKRKYKHWVWVNPNPKDAEEDLHKLYASYRAAGIHGIFFEADSEKHYRTAKKEKLEAHRWMWIMNRGEKELLEKHPEWYAKAAAAIPAPTNRPMSVITAGSAPPGKK